MVELTQRHEEGLKNLVRPQSLCRIIYPMEDVGAKEDAEISASTTKSANERAYSQAFLIKNDHYFPDNKIPENYCRVYDNGFVLSGENHLIPEGGFNQANPTETAEYSYQGYVSELISNGYGDFLDEKPYIIISFDDYYKLNGMTFYFDSVNKNHPSEMTIKSYNDGTLVDSYTTKPTNEEYVHYVSTPREGATNKIIIEFNSTNFPYRDIRITQIVFGIVKIFDNDDIKTVTVEKSVDLINSSLPVDKLSFGILDPNREYTPENPSGAYAFFEQEQVFNVYFGMCWDNEQKDVDWIKHGTYLSTGKVDVSASHIPIVSFDGISRISYLDKEFYKGIIPDSPRTLYDLATEVLEEQGWEDTATGGKWWEISAEMKKYTTSHPLPIASARDILQSLASAGCCVMYTDTDGIIQIQPKNYEGTPVFDMANDDRLSNSKITRYLVLKNIKASYGVPSLATESSEIYIEEVTNATGGRYIYDYESSKNQYLVLDGLSVTDEPVFFANRCFLHLSGTGTLRIMGQVQTLGKNVYQKDFELVGEECPISPRFIQSRSNAEAYCEWVATYLKLRLCYDDSDRGFPQLEPTDVITCETHGFGDVKAVISKSTLTFNGYLKGTTQYFSLGGGAENDVDNTDN